jgi:hypothetical protein
MTKTRFLLNLLAICAVCLLGSSAAYAQATRTWVSGLGDDANPCSRTAPCKTFAGAISKTATGGEIDVLDPGGFGAVTITKSITLFSDCIDAGVLVTGINAVVVSAGAGDVIKIRGINFDGLGNDPQATAGLAAIKVNTAKQVTVENCNIMGFTTGVEVDTGANVDIKDTRFTGLANGSTSNIGLLVQASGASVTVDHCQISAFGNGVDVKQGVVAVSRSVISHNSNIGVLAEGGGVTATVSLESCLIELNPSTGIGTTTGTSSVFLAFSSIFNNGSGVINSAGTITTLQNNRIINNGTDVTGTLTPKNQQ